MQTVNYAMSRFNDSQISTQTLCDHCGHSISHIVMGDAVKMNFQSNNSNPAHLGDNQIEHRPPTGFNYFPKCCNGDMLPRWCPQFCSLFLLLLLFPACVLVVCFLQVHLNKFI